MSELTLDEQTLCHYGPGVCALQYPTCHQRVGIANGHMQCVVWHAHVEQSRKNTHQIFWKVQLVEVRA
jgi:hypothetical protein